MFGGTLRCNPESSRMAKMQQARRRRRESTAVRTDLLGIPSQNALLNSVFILEQEPGESQAPGHTK